MGNNAMVNLSPAGQVIAEILTVLTCLTIAGVAAVVIFLAGYKMWWWLNTRTWL